MGGDFAQDAGQLVPYPSKLRIGLDLESLEISFKLSLRCQFVSNTSQFLATFYETLLLVMEIFP